MVSINEEPNKDVTMLETELKRADWMIAPESRMALSTSQSSFFGPSELLRSSASGSTSTLFATSESASTLFLSNEYWFNSEPRSKTFHTSHEWPGIEIKTLPTVGVIGRLTFVDFLRRQLSPQ